MYVFQNSQLLLTFTKITNYNTGKSGALAVTHTKPSELFVYSLTPTPIHTHVGEAPRIYGIKQSLSVSYVVGKLPSAYQLL